MLKFILLPLDARCVQYKMHHVLSLQSNRKSTKYAALKFFELPSK
jgi:hypothetical protein